MNQNLDNHNYPKLDEQLESAVWAVLSDPVPGDAVERVKQRAMRSISSDPAQAPRTQSERRFSPMMRLALAASVLAVITGGFALLPSGSSSVYAQAVQRLESLSSLVFTVQFSSTGTLTELNESQDGKKVSYLAPALHRIEDVQLGTVQIIDRKQSRSVLLLSQAKQAIVTEQTPANAVETTSPVRAVEALLNHFRADRIGDKNIKPLGTHTHGAKTLEGYESTMNGEIVRAWFDKQSFAPVIVAVRFEIPAHMTSDRGAAVSMWQIMSNIEMNADVRDTEFSATVPDGYLTLTVGASSPDTSPASLDDVVQMLRLCANANDSKFPLWLSINDDVGTPMEIQTKYLGSMDKQLAEGTEEERAKALQAAEKFGSALGRAMAFQLSVKPENDWNYFGGAKLNESNRPVLWFSPQANDNYTVVYADLSIQQVTRSDLPAKPMPLARRSTPANSIRVSTPRFELPANAIETFADLKRIREAGKQAEVEYLTLGWMPEFQESQVQLQAESLDDVVMQEVDPGWKPTRSGDSSRLGFLKEFTNLKGLDLTGLYLTQNDLQTIGALTNLQRLSLNGIYVFDESSRRLIGEDLSQLSNLQSLELLDMSQSNFVGGLQHLAELPRLHTLYLSSFEHLHDGSIAELSVLPRLETLVLAPVYATNPKTTVTEEGLESLRNLTRLKTLYVGFHGKWTLPVDRIRDLLPKVDVHAPTDGVEPH